MHPNDLCVPAECASSVTAPPPTRSLTNLTAASTRSRYLVRTKRGPRQPHTCTANLFVSLALSRRTTTRRAAASASRASSPSPRRQRGSSTSPAAPRPPPRPPSLSAAAQRPSRYSRPLRCPGLAGLRRLALVVAANLRYCLLMHVAPGLCLRQRSCSIRRCALRPSTRT